MEKRRTNVEVGMLPKQILRMSDEKSIRQHQKAHSIYFGPCKSVQNTTKML